MKGLILAGGTGARLYPLTKVTNKHLLPVGKQPMIYYPISKLVQAGITKIMIVTGIDHMGDVVSLLGSGLSFGCEFTYRVQDEAGGIAQALGLARDFVSGDKFVTILGDNIFQDDLTPYIENFKDQSQGARLLLKEVEDAKRFGVATIVDKKITKIVEKPDKPESSFAVTGVYMYDHHVFEYVDHCTPSDRGELEITDVNNTYVDGDLCDYDMLSGWWSDAGTFESLHAVSNLILEQ